MTDTVKAWIEERRTIHAGGRDVLLRSSYELERESGIEEGTDIDAIVDAHKNLPRALTALEDLIGIAHLMDEEAREYDHEGRVLAAQIARGHAASIRSAIESALEAGE